MKIKFTDNSGEVFSNVEVTFTTGGREEIYVTDKEGNIEFFEAKEGDTVTCYIHQNEKKEFTFKEGDLPVISLNAPLIDMIFVTIGKDEESVTGAQVYFEYEGKQIEKISDNTGQILLEKVPVNTDVKVFQLYNNVEHNVEINKCRIDKAQYFIITEKFHQLSNMRFKLVDKAGQLIRNADLRFKVGDKEFETVTDHLGTVTIEDVIVGSIVECKQLMFGKSLPWHKFKCEPNIDEYVLHGEKQALYAQNSEKFDSQVRMRFRLMNSKMQPIPNAVLRLEYGVNVRNKYTNQSGDAMIDDVMIGDKIKAMVSLQGKKTEAEFICQKDDELHEIIFKTGASAVYYLLIPLVLVIALVIYFASSGSSSTENKEVKKEEAKEKKDTLIIKNYQFFVNGAKSKLPVSGSKIKLIYADQEVEQITDNKGFAKFPSINKKLPVNYEISALGYITMKKPFTPESILKISLAEDDSIAISNILLPCSTVVQSKGPKVTINTFKMNMPKGKVKIWYNFFDSPDRIDIYNGKIQNMSEKNLVFTNKDYLTGISNPGFEYNSPDSVITIKITCKSGKSNWLYKIYCARLNTFVAPNVP